MPMTPLQGSGARAGLVCPDLSDAYRTGLRRKTCTAHLLTWDTVLPVPYMQLSGCSRIPGFCKPSVLVPQPFRDFSLF